MALEQRAGEFGGFSPLGLGEMVPSTKHLRFGIHMELGDRSEPLRTPIRPQGR